MISFFFFNDTAPTEIYPLSLHDALPISLPANEVSITRRRTHLPPLQFVVVHAEAHRAAGLAPLKARDRKSTRLNSSHSQISYAVFCLKKKKIALNYTSEHANHTHTVPLT